MISSTAEPGSLYESIQENTSSSRLPTELNDTALQLRLKTQTNLVNRGTDLSLIVFA